MSKVVYLLGAGASYGKRIDPEELTADDVSLIEEGLPIVNEINEEITNVINWIYATELLEKSYLFKGKECSVEVLRDELVAGFEWMQKESTQHATIDTFAKKLYLKGDNEYGRLKFFLSSFFIIEQHIHPYDKRYDAFLASILNSDMNIPDDIFVMTWNYDVQLDIAYRDYQEWGLPMCVPPETGNVNKKARVFKINGSANYYCRNQIDSCIYLKHDDSVLLDKILSQLSLTTNRGRFSDGTTDLLFAWEKNKFDELSNLLYDKISDAKVLVIIGYTFPFFNREVDREILGKMSNLEKIYIQDPKADKIMVSLKSILPEEKYKILVSTENLIFETSNFFLPPEL